MRRLAEQIVFLGVLRRVMQEAQIGMRLIGKERCEEIGRHVERRGKDRQHPVAHRAERVKIRHHVAAHPGHAFWPLVAAAQRLAGDHVGMVAAAIVADEEAFIPVRAGRLVHGRGALDRGIDRQIADIVLVEPQLQLVGERQGMEPPRGGKGAIDHRLGHAMVQRIEEPDILAGVARRGGDAPERARLAGENRGEIDDRDLRGRVGAVADRMLFKQVHPRPRLAGPDYRPGRQRGASR